MQKKDRKKKHSKNSSEGVHLKEKQSTPTEKKALHTRHDLRSTTYQKSSVKQRKRTGGRE